MAENVGYRFKPTNKEIISHFLALKIQGKGNLVDYLIGEVNICNHHPLDLPDLARITPGDNTWYFFYFPERMSGTNNRVKRVAKNGFWKPTGKDSEIKDRNGNLIGIKKTLTFQENGAVREFKASWVIHEYHHHLNLPHQNGYVLCKLIYKGEDRIGEPSFGSASGSNHQAEGNQEIQADVVSTEHFEVENEVFFESEEIESLMQYFAV